MSDQGDAEQWRPASRHSEQHSTPDDTTGPMPAVSGDEGAAPGFPPPGGEPGAWSEEGSTAGAFPSVPPAAEPPSSAFPSGRAPFEPADPSRAARSYEPQDSATDDSWRKFEHVTDVHRPAGTPAWQEPDPSAPPFNADPPDGLGESSSGYGGSDDKPYEPGESSFGYSALDGKSYESSFGYGASDDKPGEPSFGYGTSDDRPYGAGESSSGFGMSGDKPYGTGESSSGYGASEHTPYGVSESSSGFGASDDKPYEPGESSSGYSALGEKPYESSFGYGSSNDKPYGAGESSSGYGTSGDKPYDSDNALSGYGGFGEKPYEPGESSFGSTTYGETPYDTAASYDTAVPSQDGPPAGPLHGSDGSPAREQQVTAEEQAAENEFFAQDDHPPMWDKVVAPAGPPPQPGKPSSGNLRLPEWMRDENNGGGGARPGPDEFDEDGASKRALYVGVGLLVVGLIAVAGVYVLKGGGASAKSASHAAPPAKPSHSVSGSPAPSPSDQPQKTLARFKGSHTKTAGRITDPVSGLSYPRLAKPWAPPAKKSPMTELGFSASQFAVTEKAGGQPKRWARLMSAELGGAEKDAYQGPGTERAATTQVADAYEAQLYGFRHKKKLLASQPLTVGGHQGWLVGYYLTYRRPGIRATGDVLTVALVDTGKKAPGVLVMSVPNTDRKLWPDVNFVVRSLKVG